jgi:hypothetical protein
MGSFYMPKFNMKGFVLMTGFSMEEQITLAHIGIEKDFSEAVAKLVPLIGKEEKGTITIKVELARPEGLDTMLNITTSVGTSAPAPKKRKTMGRLGDGKVYIEPMSEQPDNNLVLFKNEKEGSNR